ncbi:hypothetical protein CCHR01_15947 [Colletotrichum chrysophilum]|nr:hypothetical protein CCHR01_15947 [Colletotrichum chrysophilum]
MFVFPRLDNDDILHFYSHSVHPKAQGDPFLHTMAAPPAYIISKVADPVFALVIGLGAAATRINREEKEKGRTTQETIAAAQRHVIPYC